MGTEPAGGSIAEAPAGLVVEAASVITGDPAAPRATGLWIRDGRIAGVGDPRALTERAGAGVGRLDLRDGVVVPGLIDAHCHLTMLAYLRAGADCSPEAAPDIAAIGAALAATAVGGDGWVTGSGFADYQLADRRWPTRDDLDRFVADRPAVVYHRSLHGCVVNSAGLRALGLEDGSPDPPRGMLGRDAAGRLDGRLLEGVMFDLMTANMRRHLEGLDGTARAAMIRGGAEHLASLGITACADAATDAPSFLALREAERTGALPVRVTAMFTYPEAAWLLRAGMTTGFGSDRLRIGGIKLFADGGLSSRTAALDEPFAEPPGATGFLWYEAEALAAVVAECDRAGFQVGIHAQGEKALRMVLDAFAQVIEPGNPRRHRIEHGGMFRADLRAIAGRLGIIVASQPGFFSTLGESYREALGDARMAYLYPYRSLRGIGVRIAGSSDAPVITANPFLGMRDAIVRRSEIGRVFAPEEALTASEALALYTSEAAYACGWEDRIGMLRPGMLADFTVLDRDPLTAPPATLADTVVRMTVVGGEVVFGGTLGA